MQTKKLGNSDLMITPVGVGAWAMGGAGWEYAWSSQDDNDSISAIHRALDLGVNWIDTAAVYGLGHSEEVVARAVKGMTNKPYIFTKCSLIWDENRVITSSLKADSVRHEVEASLRRLGVEQIDLYQIHWPDPDPGIEEGWATLVELQKAGKLRHIAVSNFSAEQMARAMSIAPITSNQPPYSAVKRGVEESVLPFCLQHNIGVIVYSPMQAGLLTGKMTRERIQNLPADDWRKGDEEYQEPRLSKNLRLADAMVNIAKRHNVPVPNVSIAWVLNHPAVTGAIVGVRNPKQADEVVGGGTLKLTEQDLQEIEAASRG